MNIRRRVFDAMNIMKSAGYLKKEGKVCVENTQTREEKKIMMD